ncbi:MAG: enoyl-CoA hydratase-related protein [Acidimicrobiales bacterium]
MSVLTTERHDRILVMTMERVEKRNAINPEMTAAIDAALNELDDDPDLWVGVLTGGTQVFSAGTDLKERSGKPTVRGGEYGIIRRRRAKPLIAAVEGLALGGGFEIAIACDVIVAASNARWGFPEVRRGVVASSGALFRAPRSLPLHVAKELLLTGAETSTERLERLGVVNRVTEPGGSLAAALEMAREMCANSPTAVQQTLRAVERIVGESDDFGWAATADSVRTNFASADSAEGVAAFLEKRSPNWTGR